MPIALRRCVGCRKIIDAASSRCTACQRVHRATKQRAYGPDWSAIAHAAIAASPICEDCGATADLTGEHRVPLAHGGPSTPSNVGVLCRSCNSRRGGATRR